MTRDYPKTITREEIRDLADGWDDHSAYVLATPIIGALKLVADLAEEPCRCWPSPQTGNAACPSCRARALVKT